MARVFVSTFAPTPGGVGRMLRFALSCLQRAGHEIVLAWYEHYSRSPRLSVPVWALPLRRPSLERGNAEGAAQSAAIGCWLPELEFTHYLPTRAWKGLMATCAAHVAVSGNCLAATPFALTGRPFLAWVATGWEDDRSERVRAFPPHRRLLDGVVVRPVTRRLERRILRSGTMCAISGHTARRLAALGGGAPPAVVPVPVEACALEVGSVKPLVGRVGFSGRLEDPRKNVDLLLDAIACARGRGAAVTGVLIGAWEPGLWRQKIAARGLEGAVEVVAHRERHEEVLELLASLDLFVIPSHQEGLCIAALEAMSCGCPVVSTRCGGPEDFVREGETGFWAPFTAEGMAATILRVVGDRALRGRLSGAARALVEREYSPAAAESSLMAAVRQRFPEAGL